MWKLFFCLIQHSRKYWKLSETFKPSKFCYSSYMVIITLYNLKILLSLHYFLTPQFQTFTNLLIRICEVSNLSLFERERFLRNYVSIIVNDISNNTVLQCYLLWIFVSIRRLLQIIVCIGYQPFLTSKTWPLLLPILLLNLQTIQAPLLRRFTPLPHPPPPPKFFFDPS